MKQIKFKDWFQICQSLPATEKDFVNKDWLWDNNVCSPPKLGTNWETHPLSPEISLDPCPRFLSGLRKPLRRRWGTDFPTPTLFWSGEKYQFTISEHLWENFIYIIHHKKSNLVLWKCVGLVWFGLCWFVTNKQTTPSLVWWKGSSIVIEAFFPNRKYKKKKITTANLHKKYLKQNKQALSLVW